MTSAAAQQTSEQLQVELAHRHPTAYARVIQPNYDAAPVHWRIGDALLRATQPDATRRDRRLMINMPPQNGKSQLVSVDFPAWYLGRHPDRSVMALSYGSDLATDFGRQARDQINSDLYRAIFPGLSVSSESGAAARWGIAGHRGGYIASGRAGTITGRGGDVVLIDDPIRDIEEAYSADARERVWRWYTATVYSRLRPDAIVILIQTRWHEDDLTGRLLDAAAADDSEYADDWTVLRFPAIAEDPEEVYAGLPDAERAVIEETPEGIMAWLDANADPLGRKPGEALLPDRYPVETLNTIRIVTGPENWDANFMQRPRPAKGTRFQRGWFQYVPEAPGHLQWVRYWDLAQTDELAAAAAKRRRASYTASVAAALDADGKLYLRDMVRGRWEWPDAEKTLKAVMLAEKGTTRHGIESALHGKTALQTFRRDPELAGIPVTGVVVDKSKLIRALAWQGRAEAGKVVLVRSRTAALSAIVDESGEPVVAQDWAAAAVDEFVSFPVGSWDDQVDAVSGAVEMIGHVSSIRINPETDDGQLDDAEDRGDRLRREAREANPLRPRRQGGTIMGPQRGGRGPR